MKSLHFPRRLRTWLWLGFACWIVFSAAWVARRWKAVRVLDAAPELECKWTAPVDRPWWRLLPTTRLREVSVSGGLRDGRSLAKAVRVGGGPETLEVRPDRNPNRGLRYLGAGELDAETRVFLFALGRLPSVQRLSLTNLPFDDDETARLLEQFPHVRNLSIAGMDCTGAKMPALEWLETVSLTVTPFSDEMLASLLHRPQLRALDLVETRVTIAGLRQLQQWRQKNFRSLYVMDQAWKTQDALALCAELQTACPDLDVQISNGVEMDEAP
jgi:hypothetical protein